MAIAGDDQGRSGDHDGGHDLDDLECRLVREQGERVDRTPAIGVEPRIEQEQAAEGPDGVGDRQRADDQLPAAIGPSSREGEDQERERDVVPGLEREPQVGDQRSSRGRLALRPTRARRTAPGRDR